jgi:tetratricopeptide (TPR) repeat protein
VQEALSGYEQVIRANSNLDEVIDDLTKLVDKVKTSAAAYRVLGDGLMRKGRLQDALDTYRKALNQL